MSIFPDEKCIHFLDARGELVGRNKRMRFRHSADRERLRSSRLRFSEHHSGSYEPRFLLCTP